MAFVTHKRQFANNHQQVSPGPVGSVGDVLVQSRLAVSSPDMLPRFSPSIGQIPRYGSNVQDGSFKSFDTGFSSPRVIDTNWGGYRSMQTAVGWIHQDIREPDRSVTGYLAPTQRYSWLNKIATVYSARRTGDKFLPLPGGYANDPSEITRGGVYPTTTDIVGNTVVQPPTTPSQDTKPVMKLY